MATKKKTETDIIDIDLSPIRKKKIRVDGDNNRVIFLNVSDLGIINRLEEADKRIDELMGKFGEVLESTDSEEEFDFNLIPDIDKSMREIVNFIFDSDVSDVLVPSGTMFDPINGKFTFMHVIEILMGTYENSITTETEKTLSEIQKHVKEYDK